MKIGVKTFDNPNFLKKFEDKVDFFEIMAIQTNNYDFIKDLKLPIVIHSQHERFGINVADKNKQDINKKSIDFSKKLADMGNAKKIILHCGFLDTENCSIENAISFIKSMNDKRIILENMPSRDLYPNRFSSTPEQMKKLLKETKCGFCFDINHAIESAVNNNEDYRQYIKEFVKLKPAHYHLGGQIINEKKTHLNLAECDFDLKEVLKLIPKDAEITLEVSTDLEKTLDDVNIMRRIMKELNID